MKRIFLFLTLILTIPLGAAETNWTCAIVSFEGNLSSHESFLYRQLPLQIYHQISGYETHLTTDEDRAYHSSQNSVDTKAALIDEWESLIAKRDQLLFDEDPDSYLSLTEEIRESRAKVEAFSQAPEALADELILEYITPGGGALLYETVEDLGEEEPNFIITGSINRVGEFYYIEVVGLHVDGREEALWSGTGKVEDFENFTTQIVDSVKSTLLGRDWSALSVTSMPADGQIFLNGVPLGVGWVREEILVPGDWELEIRSPGYGIYKETITLKAGQKIDREIELEKGQRALVKVTSNPPGADITLGSVHMGKTPLVIPLPSVDQQLILSLEGHQSVVTSLGPESGVLMELSLSSDLIDWEEKRVVSKDKFYNSLGYASLSLGATLILWGITENQLEKTNHYINLYNSNRTSENENKYQSAEDDYNKLNNAYWGSVGVTTALFGVSITRLVQYIIASEKSIEQKDSK